MRKNEGGRNRTRMESASWMSIFIVTTDRIWKQKCPLVLTVASGRLSTQSRKNQVKEQAHKGRGHERMGLGLPS